MTKPDFSFTNLDLPSSSSHSDQYNEGTEKVSIATMEKVTKSKEFDKESALPLL